MHRNAESDVQSNIMLYQRLFDGWDRTRLPQGYSGWNIQKQIAWLEQHQNTEKLEG